MGNFQHRYGELANNAYKVFQETVLNAVGLQVSSKWIDEEVLSEVDLWRYHPNWMGSWDWRVVLKKERKSFKRFEVAFYCDGTLCGLLVARVSKNRVNVNVKNIEGNPDPQHPLKSKLLQVALLQIELYAVAIQATMVSIDKPLAEIAGLYIQLGYEPTYSDRSKLQRGLPPRYDQLIKRLS